MRLDLRAPGEVSFRLVRKAMTRISGQVELFRNRYLMLMMGNVVGVAFAFLFGGKCLLGAVI